MTDVVPLDSVEPMDEDVGEKQRRELSAAMNHWLNLFDTLLSDQDLALPARPLRALMMLFQEGAIEVKAGERMLGDPGKLGEDVEKIWFRILFDAVEYWYVERYGKPAMEGSGSAPLTGAVMVRSVPFAIVAPANRSKIEEEGESCWMYFEEGLGEGEEAAEWIMDAPDISKLDVQARSQVIDEATKVVEILRYIEFRRVAFHVDGDHEVQKLIQSTLTYIEQAAKRLVTKREREIGPAWFDLQMANEAALKAVIRMKSGKQPKIHPLDDLLKRAGEHGVLFSGNLLSDWPTFNDISDWRYGQGSPPGSAELYSAYCLTLDLVQACMMQIVPGMKPGFRILIKYSPWKLKNASGKFRE